MLRANALLEHWTGIGPAHSAWEANVLPLNYQCDDMNEYNILTLYHQFFCLTFVNR